MASVIYYPQSVFQWSRPYFTERFAWIFIFCLIFGTFARKWKDKPLSYLIRACERSSIDWRTTKIKLTTTANQKKGKYLQEPIRTQRKTTEMPKARENAGDQVVIGFLVLHLIGWKRGASSLDQLQSDVNQIPSNSRVFSTFIENCCNYFVFQPLRGRGKFMELVWWRWRHASINSKGKQWFFFSLRLNAQFCQSCFRCFFRAVILKKHKSIVIRR